MSILAGVGILAALLGVEEHVSAKETNKSAQSIVNNAQSLYNNTKRALEVSQRKTQETLLCLGNEKRIVLESSMKEFLKYYDKIKHIKFIDTSGIDEISNFSIDQQGVIEMQQMTDVYASTIKSGVVGAAAGTVIALATSGAMADMALAGSFLADGAIGTAAGIAGSSLSFAAGVTPLGVIAAPVLLFTGISAGMKADENMEKANAMYAEAEVASEKMKVSITLCNAICERADMLNGVLKELTPMFSECTSLLAGVLRKKDKKFFKKKMTSEDFSEEEIRLIAVTRALAGAVKAVIDTPILSSNGAVSQRSFDVYNQANKRLPDFNNEVEEIRQIDYKAKPISIKSVKEIQDKEAQKEKRKLFIKEILVLLRNVCAIGLGIYIATIACSTLAELVSNTENKILVWKSIDVNRVAVWLVIFAIITMLVGKLKNTIIEILCRLCTGIGLSALFLQFCWIMERVDHYILISICICIVGTIAMCIATAKNDEFINSYSFLYCCALLSYVMGFWLYAFLTMGLDWSKTVCLVIAFLMTAVTIISLACIPLFDK